MDSNKIYVGNIPFEATSTELMEFFSQYGEILEAMVIPNRRFPGKSKGFGFVTFSSADSAQKALSAHGQDFSGRNLVVSLAKAKDAEAANDPQEVATSNEPVKSTIVYQSTNDGNTKGTN